MLWQAVLGRLQLSRIFLQAACLAAALPVMASAQTVGTPTANAAPRASAPAQMKCPVGGEAFVHAPPVAVPPVGMRPDGRPYGAGVYPAKLPECPSNGLVLYKDYNAAEVEKLTPLVASEAFQAQRTADTSYYRAYELMRELGERPDDYLWALLQASWQADANPELRTRYLSELAEASASVPARPADVQWVGMEGRAINALRELGRFDEAAARLAKVPLTGLETKAAAGSPSSAEMRLARNRRGWLDYYESLRAAIARKDASREPFDMIPRSVALGKCIDAAAQLGENQRAFCDSVAVRSDIDKLRARRAAAKAELDALGRSREEAGR